VRAALLLLFVLTAYLILPAQPLTPVAPSSPAVGDTTGVDSAVVVKPVLRGDTARVVMHQHNHRQQIITGGAIMATLIGVMVVMNNYNPRVPPQ
jgi:hypothetical protein